LEATGTTVPKEVSFSIAANSEGHATFTYNGNSQSINKVPTSAMVAVTDKEGTMRAKVFVGRCFSEPIWAKRVRD